MNNNQRSLSRYLAVQAIYQINETSITCDEILCQFDKHYINNICFDFKNSFKESFLKADKNYFKNIIENYFLRKTKVIELISSNLSENWTIERLPKVLQAIIKVSIVEMMISPNLSLAIVASEYIILTETFFTKKESSFINALIEKIYKIIKNEELHKQ